MSTRNTRFNGHYLGIDGGGTSTRAIIIDDTGAVIGEGFSGPANALRVGVRDATRHIREAVDHACAQAGIELAQIAAAELGLAGTRRREIRERMRKTVGQALAIRRMKIGTDADIALDGATDGEPGLVLIAGTGSICCGVNANGVQARAGGWGPAAGDEGSGYSIARRALQSVSHAADGRGARTGLSAAACQYFDIASVDELGLAMAAPGLTHDRFAGFARRVIEVARQGDTVAREILRHAGAELATLAIAVIRQLGMQQDRFDIAYVGGVFNAGDLVMQPLIEALQDIAPRAELTAPRVDPAVAAARRARARAKAPSSRTRKTATGSRRVAAI
jgi:N-acetylglucosamine kinase-like BadF-type ATPase